MAPGRSFSGGQVSELQRVIDIGRQISGLSFGIYVGDLPGGRESAVARHAQLNDAPAAVLVAVDPADRAIEIVTGSHAVRALDDRSCELAVLAMKSSFEAGDLVGGIRDAVNLLAQRARAPHVVHEDEPA
ncbi:MAG: DUF5130 family protein [Actinobacteria bacterium]|uniref:Unannotated protein n=1 Tax=freshwater metagenome TaxID=449393 RepID=A0A6J7LYM8_9ZZZZ|nr:DUF5130 family protein [Actinomycetota bacterium]